MSVTLSVVEPGIRRLHCRSWRGGVVGYDVSAYMIDDVLIDTGFSRTRAELVAAVESLSPRGAVVTHWHEDHAGNVPALAASGLPLALDARCETTLRERPSIAPYRSLIWGRTPRLAGPVIDFDVAPLELIPAPGHTADHQVVWDPARRVVASGDLFLGVKVRVAHEHESPRQVVESLRRVAALEPRLLLDAHRGPIANPVPLLRAKIAWMEETIGAVQAHGDSGMSARAITRRVLGREDLVGWASVGEYSKVALVRAILRGEGGD